MNTPLSPPGRQCGPGWEWEEKGSGARAWRELRWGSGAKPWLRRSLLVTHPRDARGGEAADNRARATAPGVQFMVPGRGGEEAAGLGAERRAGGACLGSGCRPVSLAQSSLFKR